MTLLYRLIKIITKSITIQILLTVASLPILIGWGLPISLASVIGNLIFTPFLMLFIIASSSLFFAHIMGLPHAILVTFLNGFTDFWQNLLSVQSPSWLVYSWCPSTPVLIVIIIIMFLILRFFIRKILALVFLLTLTCIGLYTMHKIQTKEHIEVIAKNLSIQQDLNGNLTLIDYGFLSRKKTLASYVHYELKPLLAKRYGSIRIKEILLLMPSQQCLRSAEQLSLLIPIEKITCARGKHCTLAHACTTNAKDS